MCLVCITQQFTSVLYCIFYKDDTGGTDDGNDQDTDNKECTQPKSVGTCEKCLTGEDYTCFISSTPLFNVDVTRGGGTGFRSH